jgi:meiotically up-regulated gene 157 (Mug157) protein
MNRRHFLQTLMAALPLSHVLPGWAQTRASLRPAPSDRHFVSAAVDARIAQVMAGVADADTRWMFEACFPDTLDRAVRVGTRDGHPDTFLITGDIDAMWLRDSTAQVGPYIPLAAGDAALRTLLTGLVRRHAACILIDPYANAFTFDPHTPSPHSEDKTDMRPGVYERKYELDSLCYVLRLAHEYWAATGDVSCYDDSWREAMRRVVQTMREQQRLKGPGPYRFESLTYHPAGTLWEGLGYPTRPCGLIHTAFRPSDDAGTYSFLIPANLFAAHTLKGLAAMLRAIFKDEAGAVDAEHLSDEVHAAVLEHGVVRHPTHGLVYAFEVDGFGNAAFLDDANVPSLLSMPYLGCVKPDDAVYRRTRALVLSADNPYYYAGQAGHGIGSIHTPRGYVWPLSIVTQALTGTTDAEIQECLLQLRNTHAGTGQIHESFNQDDATQFSRPWFGWANVLYGELIGRIYDTRPHLLR